MHINTHTQMHACTHIHTCTHTSLTHTHTNACTHTLKHTHTHMHTHTHTHTHTHGFCTSLDHNREAQAHHMHSHTHTHTNACTHTHKHSNARMHTHTHTSLTHTHKCMHTNTHTHTQTHPTHTHTHWFPHLFLGVEHDGGGVWDAHHVVVQVVVDREPDARRQVQVQHRQLGDEPRSCRDSHTAHHKHRADCLAKGRFGLQLHRMNTML